MSVFVCVRARVHYEQRYFIKVNGLRRGDPITEAQKPTFGTPPSSCITSSQPVIPTVDLVTQLPCHVAPVAR